MLCVRYLLYTLLKNEFRRSRVPEDIVVIFNNLAMRFKCVYAAITAAGPGRSIVIRVMAFSEKHQNLLMCPSECTRGYYLNLQGIIVLTGMCSSLSDKLRYYENFFCRSFLYQLTEGTQLSRNVGKVICPQILYRDLQKILHFRLECLGFAPQVAGIAGSSYGFDSRA